MNKNQLYHALLCHLKEEWAPPFQPTDSPTSQTLKRNTIGTNSLPRDFHNISEEEMNDPYPDSEAKRELLKLRHECEQCQKCSLSKTATRLVFGEGDPQSRIVFVGEAPGGDEDRLGRPFVGRAGKLLSAVLEQIGVKRTEVYICNILKHRPPGNRNPLREEIEACAPYLIRQLKIIQPALVVTLGNFSAKFLLNTEFGISQLRGKLARSPFGMLVLPTFHPAFVLRNNQYQSLLQEDISKAFEFARIQQ